MAALTTGTTSFNLNLNELVEEAYERCGAEARTGYDFRTARRSLNLMLAEWANRGINMWTMDSGTIPLVAGTATYTLPLDTVDLLDSVIRTGTGSNQVDIAISRIAESTYATIPNKNATGRPIQVWIQRLSGASPSAGVTVNPQITVWPIPDSSTTYTYVYWRLRRLQDAGDGINGQDIPFRFLPVLVAGLAYYLSFKIPGADQRSMGLKDREKAPVRLVPRRNYMR